MVPNQYPWTYKDFDSPLSRSCTADLVSYMRYQIYKLKIGLHDHFYPVDLDTLCHRWFDRQLKLNLKYGVSFCPLTLVGFMICWLCCMVLINCWLLLSVGFISLDQSIWWLKSPTMILYPLCLLERSVIKSFTALSFSSVLLGLLYMVVNTKCAYLDCISIIRCSTALEFKNKVCVSFGTGYLRFGN